MRLLLTILLLGLLAGTVHAQSIMSEQLRLWPLLCSEAECQQGGWKFWVEGKAKRSEEYSLPVQGVDIRSQRPEPWIYVGPAVCEPWQWCAGEAAGGPEAKPPCPEWLEVPGRYFSLRWVQAVTPPGTQPVIQILEWNGERIVYVPLTYPDHAAAQAAYADIVQQHKAWVQCQAGRK